MLTVEHLTFSYSRRSAPVLRDAALTLRDGEIGILLGRNGSGKTTLFRNLLGICTPDSGSIRFDGQELTALPRRQRARCIAYVPQDIRFGDLTVFDSVLLGRLSRFGLQAGPADRAAAAVGLAVSSGLFLLCLWLVLTTGSGVFLLLGALWLVYRSLPAELFLPGRLAKTQKSR